MCLDLQVLLLWMCCCVIEKRQEESERKKREREVGKTMDDLVLTARKNIAKCDKFRELQSEQEERGFEHRLWVSLVLARICLNGVNCEWFL